jgi:hypothetical protein
MAQVPKFVSCDWQEYMFSESSEPEIGQRLGIQYLQASQPFVTVKVGGAQLQLQQESMGLMAISGVVWDAGLLLVDFLQQLHDWGTGISGINADADVGDGGEAGVAGEAGAPCVGWDLGRVLDLGCGTGVAGVSAALLGAHSVVFTDIAKLDCLDENIGQLTGVGAGAVAGTRATFVAYEWGGAALPEALTHSAGQPLLWDTVLCSDLLYNEKHHAALLGVLRRLSFSRAVFAYKKRHDGPERLFFSQLAVWCSVRVLAGESLQLRNLPPKSAQGLHIVLVRPLPLSS